MRETIEFIQVEEKEKVLGTLASAVEAGLSSSLKGLTPKSAFVSCSRIERTNLQALLESPPAATFGMEIRYHTGLRGSALLVIRLADLVQLSEILSGVAANGGEMPGAELMESCMRFFTRAMEESDKRFAEQLFKTASQPPALINPDGNAEALRLLEGPYAGGLCATYQVTAEPALALRIYMLVSPELLHSLIEQSPESVLSRPDGVTAEQRGTMRREPTGDTGRFAESSEGSSFLPSGAARQKDSGNWNIDLLLDVELPVHISFGEAEMLLKDVLKLGVGSVIELDKSVNDPVTVVVNKKPIARGEVVMVEGNYGIRILEVESTAERIRSLG